MTQSELREALLAKAEEKYRTFTSKLLPGVENILGVRLPTLRGIAKRAAAEGWRTLFDKEEAYFEETMVKGMVIGYAKMPEEERRERILRFLPKIDNWSLCDSFCSTLRVKPDEKEAYWQFLIPLFADTRPFFCRFALVMTLRNYIEKERLEEVFEILCGIRSEAYYVKMAAGWAVCECACLFPEETRRLLASGSLDPAVQKIAQRKIRESFRA